MISQTGNKMIKTHIFPDTSRSEGNQAILLGQLIKYNVKNIFLQKLCINEAERLVPNHFLSLKKVLQKVKASALLVCFNKFW